MEDEEIGHSALKKTRKKKIVKLKNFFAILIWGFQNGESKLKALYVTWKNNHQIWQKFGFKK